MRTSVDVHNYLVERDVPHEIVLARGRLRSPERTASVFDLSPSVVGRVEILEGARGPIAVATTLEQSIDLEHLRRLLHSPHLTRVPPERASEVTEYLAESIPPVGLPPRIKLRVDRAFDQDDVFYFPGGEARAVLKIRGPDLIRASGAKVLPLGSPPTPEAPAR